MDAQTGTVEHDRTEDTQETCRSDFLLEQIQVGCPDKLGNRVFEILWCGKDYVIYRSAKGVFVNFSDCAKRETEQRLAFTEICPELCELRFLTQEMQSGGWAWWSRRRGNDENGVMALPGAASLFDHNIAQALMLLMENRRDEAKSIAAAALEMAVKRSTNDNTIRYVRASMVAALVSCATIAMLGYASYLQYSPALLYFVAGFFGVLGAAFSVAIRVRSFQAKPCQQSNMNYLMARLRIGVGLVSALILYLVVGKSVGGAVIRPEVMQGPEGAAIVGFLGGFAERLVPTVFRRAAEAFDESSGTPVQLARVRPAPPAAGAN